MSNSQVKGYEREREIGGAIKNETQRQTKGDKDPTCYLEVWSPVSTCL